MQSGTGTMSSDWGQLSLLRVRLIKQSPRGSHTWFVQLCGGTTWTKSGRREKPKDSISYITTGFPKSPFALSCILSIFNITAF